jgi:hypothetical protein
VRVRIGLPGVVYLVFGAYVSKAHNYFHYVGMVKPAITAALAVVLWPLIIVFGVHFHVT